RNHADSGRQPAGLTISSNAAAGDVIEENHRVILLLDFPLDARPASPALPNGPKGINPGFERPDGVSGIGGDASAGLVELAGDLCPEDVVDTPGVGQEAVIAVDDQ